MCNRRPFAAVFLFMDSPERRQRDHELSERSNGAAVVMHYATDNPRKRTLFGKLLAGTEFYSCPSATKAPELDERLYNRITAFPHVIAAVKAACGDGDYTKLLSRAVGTKAAGVFGDRVRLITIATDVMLLTPIRVGLSEYPVYLGHNKPPEQAEKVDIETYLLTYFSEGNQVDANANPGESAAGFRVGAGCLITDLENKNGRFTARKKRGLAGFFDLPFTYAPFTKEEIAGYVRSSDIEILRGVSAGCRWESPGFWKHLRSIDGVPQGSGFDRQMFLTMAKGGFPELSGLIGETEFFFGENAVGSLTSEVRDVGRQLNGMTQNADLGSWGRFSGSRDVFRL